MKQLFKLLFILSLLSTCVLSYVFNSEEIFFYSFISMIILASLYGFINNVNCVNIKN